MDYRKYKATKGGYKIVIEEDLPDVGVYMYIYESGACIKDYLQNNIDICKEIALNDYDIPLDSWIEVQND